MLKRPSVFDVPVISSIRSSRVIVIVILFIIVGSWITVEIAGEDPIKEIVNHITITTVMVWMSRKGAITWSSSGDIRSCCTTSS